MNEKKKLTLEKIHIYITETNNSPQSINDFSLVDQNLPSEIKKIWDSQNDFFNELSEFLFKVNSTP